MTSETSLIPSQESGLLIEKLKGGERVAVTFSPNHRLST